jgi:DNA repair photolyase
MSLKKSTGNMYPWVTHTHCHLGGQCPHKCVYCYVDNFPYGRPEKYKGALRLIEKLNAYGIEIREKHNLERLMK